MTAGSTTVVLSSLKFALSRGLVLPLVVLAPLVLTTPGRAEAQEPVTAVWKARQLDFSYRGYAVVYPCSALQHRIALVLNAVGARPDLEVTVRNCDLPFAPATVPAGDGAGWPRNSPGSGDGYSMTVPPRDDGAWPQNASGAASGYYRRSEPRQEVDVRVRLSVPVETTPEVIAELEADRRRRALITRVTGDPLPLFDNPIPFAANRQVVTLSRDTAGVNPGDCELLDQMAASILRELGVRVVRRGYNCDRSRASRIAPTLDVEALVPVAFDPDPPAASAPGDESTDAPVPGDDDEAPATIPAEQIPD